MAQLEGVSVMVVEEKARLPRQNFDDDQLISEMAPGQGVRSPVSLQWISCSFLIQKIPSIDL